MLDDETRNYERELVLGNLEVLTPYLASQERYGASLQKRCDLALSAWMKGEHEPRGMIEKLVEIQEEDLPPGLLSCRKWLVEGYAMYRLMSRLVSWSEFEVGHVQYNVKRHNTFSVDIDGKNMETFYVDLVCDPQRGDPFLDGSYLPPKFMQKFPESNTHKTINGKEILERLL